MKYPSQRVISAMSSNRLKPVWLLKLDLKSADSALSLYLSDRPITLWGQPWKPLVTAWGTVDCYFDPTIQETGVSDMTVKLANTPGLLGAGTHGISWYFRKYSLISSTATIYLWLDGAELLEPAGQDQNDLLTVLSGVPEIASGISPLECPLDIVAHSVYSGGDTSLGNLLNGVYTRNQWESLPPELEGQYKPAVFGHNVQCKGIALSSPFRCGQVAGPADLFDSTKGADHVLITYPKSGAINSASPFPAPCDIYIGDWRLTVSSPPELFSGDTWKYKFGSAKSYIPTPLDGTEPLFVPSSAALWPRSQDSGHGPYAISEPPCGAPFQFYHGHSDTGNSKDGLRPGRSGSYIMDVYVNGSKVQDSQVVRDDAFGIGWIKLEGSSVHGKLGNPSVISLKWTARDQGFNSGDTYLHAAQLTASWPYGYNVDANPCILGDFSVPASGGGAPASTQLGLVNSPRYAFIGARIASARFVMRYTAPEVTSGTFHASILGSSYSFAASELVDGSSIASLGWFVAKQTKGTSAEIWPNNNGYPNTQTSPVARKWDIYELSRDVTEIVQTNAAVNNGLAGGLQLWFSGSAWPASLNSVVLLSCELEIQYEGVASAAERPEVTAIIGSSSSTAGQILKQLLPSTEIGAGYDDPSLPKLKITVDSQRTLFSFAKSVAKEAGYSISRNSSTGKLDLVLSMDNRDNANPPAPTGGFADIAESSLLLGADGGPIISRLRSAPENVVNEVTVSFTNMEGARESVTVRDEASISSYGLRVHNARLSSATLRADAESYALGILNANAGVNDFYKMTFPLGPAMFIEPNDVLRVTAGLDNLDLTRMRVVSVETDPGSLADGVISTITVTAQRFNLYTSGFGRSTFGPGPFGSGQIMEN
ncbi:MAG: hypothetical protein HZB29_13915 [Nitrospinae bacterium]|nr:hypothetical protein [Nitrospinota bacterium]